MTSAGIAEQFVVAANTAFLHRATGGLTAVAAGGAAGGVGGGVAAKLHPLPSGQPRPMFTQQ